MWLPSGGGCKKNDSTDHGYHPEEFFGEQRTRGGRAREELGREPRGGGRPVGGMAKRRGTPWEERLPQTRPEEDAEGYRWHEDIMECADEDDESDKDSTGKDAAAVNRRQKSGAAPPQSTWI